MDVNISDHEMIYITRKHVKKAKSPSSFQGRSYYANYNEEIFLQQLDEFEWYNLFECMDPEFAWSIVENNILRIE